MRTGNFGAKNGFWKRGRSVASNGYVLIRVGKKHHLSDVRGYAYEHRIVAENKIGRRLLRGEQVHHINGNKQDNSVENTEVVSCIAEHMQGHRKKPSNRRLFNEANPVISCACGCGESFLKYDTNGRPRHYISGHNPPDISKQNSIIAAAGDGKSVAELAAITGMTFGATKTMACKLVKKKKLVRINKGIYGRTYQHPLD